MANVVREAISAMASDKKNMDSEKIKDLLQRLAAKYSNASSRMSQCSALFHFTELLNMFPTLSPKQYDSKFIYGKYRQLEDKFANCLGDNMMSLVKYRQKEILLRISPKIISNQFQKNQTVGVISTENNFKKLTISNK